MVQYFVCDNLWPVFRLNTPDDDYADYDNQGTRIPYSKNLNIKTDFSSIILHINRDFVGKEGEYLFNRNREIIKEYLHYMATKD